MLNARIFAKCLFFLILLLSACHPSVDEIAQNTATAANTTQAAWTLTQIATATSTPTPKLTRTPTSTHTPAPNPTDTSLPSTLTFTTPPGVALAPQEVLEEAGFSFQAPQDYHPTYRTGLVNLSNVDESVFVMLIGAVREQPVNLAGELEGFLNYASQNVIQEMQSEDVYPFHIQSLEGLAVDVAGKVYGNTRQGTIVMVSPDTYHVFTAFGIGVNEKSNLAWEEQGKKSFEAVLGSLEFFEPVPMNNFCPLSADPTFGYSKDNPVRVGGNDFEGPMRERAYLDHLKGPQGQSVGYERSGSIEHNRTILDIYQLGYPGRSEPVTIYIDEYRYGPLKAPIGFICEEPFPLKAP